MPCPAGRLLLEKFEIAEQRKRTAANRTAVADAASSPVSKAQMLAAKQLYVQTFADWLTHRTFCHECKPSATSQKIPQLGHGRQA